MSTRLERLQERAKIVRNWRGYARKVAASAKQLFGNGVEVYAFGSVVKGEAIAASDVDLIVIVNDALHSIAERNKLKMMLEDVALLPDFHPFEIHIVDRREAAVYFRHIGPEILKIET